MAFHNILYNLLENNNLTQKQVANELNISPSTLGGYVQGTREPDFSTLIRLAQYFKVSTDYLLDVQTDCRSLSGENELLQIYRSLGEDQRMLYIEQGRAFIRFNCKKNPQKKSS